MVPPEGIGVVGVKARVTGTDDLPAMRSDEAMMKDTDETRKPTTATGVSRLFPDVPSPICRKHLVSTKKISPHTHNTLASQQAKLLGHRH